MKGVICSLFISATDNSHSFLDGLDGVEPCCWSRNLVDADCDEPVKNAAAAAAAACWRSN
jgi:hypothetical protein